MNASNDRCDVIEPEKQCTWTLGDCSYSISSLIRIYEDIDRGYKNKEEGRTNHDFDLYNHSNRNEEVLPAKDLTTIYAQ